jgi:hypothetical protein
MICEHEVCPWYQSGWVVQVTRDGKVVERDAGPKQFEKLSSDAEAAARRNIEQMALEDPEVRRHLDSLRNKGDTI